MIRVAKPLIDIYTFQVKTDHDKAEWQKFCEFLFEDTLEDHFYRNLSNCPNDSRYTFIIPDKYRKKWYTFWQLYFSKLM